MIYDPVHSRTRNQCHIRRNQYHRHRCLKHSRTHICAYRYHRCSEKCSQKLRMCHCSHQQIYKPADTSIDSPNILAKPYTAAIPPILCIIMSVIVFSPPIFQGLLPSQTIPYRYRLQPPVRSQKLQLPLQVRKDNLHAAYQRPHL